MVLASAIAWPDRSSEFMPGAAVFTLSSPLAACVHIFRVDAIDGFSPREAGFLCQLLFFQRQSPPWRGETLNRVSPRCRQPASLLA